MGAKKKAKFRWRSERAASPGVKSILMPSASSTSALPAFEVTARLPCLATVTPAAAQRIAAVREHSNEVELVNLTLAIATINSWNRIAISFRTVPGSYQPLKASVDKAPA